MRLPSGPERTVLGSQRFDIHGWVEIQNADGTWIDVTSRWISTDISTDIDQPVWSAVFAFARDDAANTASLSPLRSDSTLNVDDAAAYAPLITAGRRIRQIVACVAAGVTPLAGDKKELFTGRVDKPNFGTTPMTVDCRDLGGQLIDTIISEKRTYGDETGIPAEDVMQQILDDVLGAGVVTLIVPSLTGYNVTDYTPLNVSVMEALNALALKFGGVVRYRYASDGVSKLTVYVPPRTGGSTDATIPPTEYIEIPTASIDSTNVRNKIRGVGIDPVTGEPFTLEVTDTSSINAFNGGVPLFMQLGAGVTEGMTPNEVLAMIGFALEDLKYPKFDHVVTSLLFWPSEVGDSYQFSANAVHYNAAQTLAVMGINHHLEAGHGTTTWTCRGTPAGAYLEWIRRQGTGPTGPLIPPAPELLFLLGELTQFGGTLDEVDGALWLGYRMPAGVDEIQVFAVLGNGQDLPVPDTTATTLALTLRRPDGDIGRVQQLGGREGGEIGEYVSMACLSTRPEMWKRVLFRGVRGGLTSKPTITASVNAIDPTPTTDDSLMTIASLDVVRSGSTNTVTVTPGTLDTSVGNDDNFVVIIRNEHILPPIFVQGSSAPRVFVDSGLDPSVAATYVYDAFIWNGGQSGGRARAIAQPPTIVAPEFALGTPLAAVVGTVPKVQISWTGATPGADGVFVQASLDGLTGFRSVGFGNLASDTVYDSVTGPKLYRLVAYDTATSDQIAYSPWQYFNGLPTSVSNPAALPKFVNGTPKAVLTNVGSPLNPSFLAYLSVQWNCATPGAALIAVQSSPDNIAAYTDVTNGVSGSVAFGEWKSPNNTAAKTDAYYRLQARASDGTTVLATSAPIHYIPPS